MNFVCSINDIIYSIEMNNCSSIDVLHRNIGYAVDLSKGGINMGDNYDFKNVIQLNLCNFTFEGHNEVIEE